MLIKGYVSEDFANYKKACSFVIFPSCTFKCDREAGEQVCQNSCLAKAEARDVPAKSIAEACAANPITRALCCGGLEPMDSFSDLLELLDEYRKLTDDDFVVYTGYEKGEVADKVEELSKRKNVVVKFGRFRYGLERRFDETLGVWLASPNQRAEKIS